MVSAVDTYGSDGAAPQVIPLTSPERAQLVQRRNASPCTHLWQRLDQVKDPEIPVLSLWDLGVLQDVIETNDGVTVIITPTYSGCPAMDMMADEIRLCLAAAGVENVTIETRLSPAWTTDWLDQEAKQALRQYGIAPPARTNSAGQQTVICPHCGSHHTTTISEFGSTACKALYRCLACEEPFDYFKPL